MMEEALEAILLLLAGETVTMETEWFTLVKARLQLRPYQRPFPEVAVAAQVSPAGPRAGGALRLQPALHRRHHRPAASTCWARTGTSWRSGPPSSRPRSTATSWRLVGPMHIADTKEQAVADVAFGLEEWVDYFQRVAALPVGARHRQLRVAGRRAQRLGLRRHRHGRRRHRADRAPAGAVGRLRHLPPHGPRVGRHRGHPPLLRAVRPLRGAPLPGLGGVADREPGLGRREPPRVHRRGRQRRHVGHPEAPRGEGREGRQRRWHPVPDTPVTHEQIPANGIELHVAVAGPADGRPSCCATASPSCGTRGATSSARWPTPGTAPSPPTCAATAPARTPARSPTTARTS